MARRKDAGHGGGHGWFVTFADLMGLMVGFFVMLVAFSNQDQQKLQIVAGSMRDAFGVQQNVRYSGIIEVPGLPTRPKLRNSAHIPPEEASANPTPDEHDRQRTMGARLKEDRAFALAAASLRQALQDMPELTEISKHIVIEESKDGLNVEIVDQDGRSMFPEGSKEPYERTRRLIEKLSAPLKSTPYRLAITGHTAGLRPVGAVGRPRQRGAPHSRGAGGADRPVHAGRRQVGHPAAVSRRPVHRRQPPRHHHADARGAADPDGFPAVENFLKGVL
jgi:chemotaxis protein MotB